MRLPGRLAVWLARRGRPPRLLTHDSWTNVAILRAFGAEVGEGVRVHAPVVLHEAASGYRNLRLGDGCLLSGNNYIDLSGRVTLEPGVSLGPGVVVMTHNNFNYNDFLEGRLGHQSGVADVLIRHGSGVKAGAVIAMGVTIGEHSVVAAGAVVNNDIPARCLFAGVPARQVRALD